MIWRTLRQTLRRFASCPYQERVIADEREIKDSLKLPSVTFFILQNVIGFLTAD
jgi:hypothetical protein